MKEESNAVRGRTALIITAAICAILVVSILVAFFFADAFIGRGLLKDARTSLESCETIVMSDLLYRGNILPSASESILLGEDVDKTANELIAALEDVSFEGMISGKSGFWDVYLRVDNGKESILVYLREDTVYFTRKDRGYVFKPKGESKNAYLKLYQNVLERLNESAQ